MNLKKLDQNNEKYNIRWSDGKNGSKSITADDSFGIFLHYKEECSQCIMKTGCDKPILEEKDKNSVIEVERKSSGFHERPIYHQKYALLNGEVVGCELKKAISLDEYYKLSIECITDEIMRSKDVLDQLLVTYTIKRAIDGDEKAINKLCKRYEEKIISIVKSLLGFKYHNKGLIEHEFISMAKDILRIVIRGDRIESFDDILDSFEHGDDTTWVHSKKFVDALYWYLTEIAAKDEVKYNTLANQYKVKAQNEMIKVFEEEFKEMTDEAVFKNIYEIFPDKVLAESMCKGSKASALVMFMYMWCSRFGDKSEQELRKHSNGEKRLFIDKIIIWFSKTYQISEQQIRVTEGDIGFLLSVIMNPMAALARKMKIGGVEIGRDVYTPNSKTNLTTWLFGTEINLKKWLNGKGCPQGSFCQRLNDWLKSKRSPISINKALRSIYSKDSDGNDYVKYDESGKEYNNQSGSNKIIYDPNKEQPQTEDIKSLLDEYFRSTYISTRDKQILNSRSKEKSINAIGIKHKLSARQVRRIVEKFKIWLKNR